ncbi:Alpha/Beta hydrolase protein [Xylaria arbuscula]|nr:Alpha/Beta hydrolase protein [Xylaria arbuscula]
MHAHIHIYKPAMETASRNEQHISIQTRDSTHRLLLPDDTYAHSYAGNHPDDIRSAPPGTPLIICFHGSGETCSPSWDDLAARLVAETRCRVLLYDRGPGNLRAADVAAQMWDYVLGGAKTIRTEDKSSGSNLHGPYLLVAHSYGGAFARAFVEMEYLRLRGGRRGWCGMARDKGNSNSNSNSDSGDHARDCVIGLVLVETGQEGGLEPAVDERQIQDTIMGDRPVCVIRGNSLLGKWRELETRERTAQAGEENDDRGGDDATAKVHMRQMLAAEREMLLCVDAEDERLKRRQLGLSRMSRFVQLSDCGHGVISQRPGDVVDAVRWVLDNAEGVHRGDEDGKEVSAWGWVVRRVRRLMTTHTI